MKLTLFSALLALLFTSSAMATLPDLSKAEGCIINGDYLDCVDSKGNSIFPASAMLKSESGQGYEAQRLKLILDMKSRGLSLITSTTGESQTIGHLIFLRK